MSDREQAGAQTPRPAEADEVWAQAEEAAESGTPAWARSGPVPTATGPGEVRAETPAQAAEEARDDGEPAVKEGPEG